MNILDNIIKDLIQVLKESKDNKTSPYDTLATVTRIEDDIAWVHIAGGVSETPVALTINAKKGDKVQCRITSNGACIIGNVSSPPTDDTKANIANEKATIADEKSSKAIDYASVAEQAATLAQESASTAHAMAESAIADASLAQEAADSATTAAETAEAKADIANSSATIAFNSATAAQWQLAAVEDVVGTLEWIATHAIYKLTNDSTVELGKWYYTLTATVVQSADLKVFDLQSGRYYLQTSEYRYSAVEEPDVSDIATYYEYDPETGTYSLTEDVTIDDEKTYYTRSSFTYYVAATGSSLDPSKTYYTVIASAVSPVATANPHALGYYEIDSYDKTVQNYISTHLSLDENGLHLTDGSLQNRMDISQNTGITLYNGGTKIAQYGRDTIIGDENSYHIEITAGTPNDLDDPPMLSFVTGSGVKVAYMTGEVLNIPRVVVVDSMQIGNWMWDGKTNPKHLTLKWIGATGGNE